MRTGRKRRRTVPPDAVMAQRKAVVGGVDDDGIVIQPQLLKGLQDAADAVVDERNLAEKIAQGFDVVGQQQRSLELLTDAPAFLHPQAEAFEHVRVQSFTRDGVHIAVVVQAGEFILRPSLDRRPVTVGPIVGHEGEERTVLPRAVFEELDGLFGEEVDGVSGELVALVVVDDFVVIEAGGVAVGERHPVVKGQLRHEGNTEVELADQGGGIAGLLEHHRQGVEFGDGRPVLWPLPDQPVVEPVVQAVLAGHEPGQDRRPAG